MEREAPLEEVQVLFVGVDGHKNTSQITVMDAAGKILKRQRVLSTPEDFRQNLAEFSETNEGGAGGQLLLGSDVRLVR